MLTSMSTALGAVVTAGMLAATVWPQIGWQVAGAHPWLSIVSGATFSVGAVTTSRLLGARDQRGAWAAAGTLVASIVSAFAGGQSIVGTTGIDVVGLVLLASVWQHLE